MALTRRRRRSTIAIKYMTLLSEQRKPEADRSGETVTLKCGVCGQSLSQSTIGHLLRMKRAGALSELINQPYSSHMGITGHTQLVSDHELVVVNDYGLAGVEGMVGIKLNYP